MDKSKNRTDLLAAGRKKLQQFRQKKDGKGSGSSSHGKSSKKHAKVEEHDTKADSVSSDDRSAESSHPTGKEMRQQHADSSESRVDSSVSPSADDVPAIDDDKADESSLLLRQETNVQTHDVVFQPDLPVNGDDLESHKVLTTTEVSVSEEDKDANNLHPALDHRSIPLIGTSGGDMVDSSLSEVVLKHEVIEEPPRILGADTVIPDIQTDADGTLPEAEEKGTSSRGVSTALPSEVEFLPSNNFPSLSAPVEVTAVKVASHSENLEVKDSHPINAEFIQVDDKLADEGSNHVFDHETDLPTEPSGILDVEVPVPNEALITTEHEASDLGRSNALDMFTSEEGTSQSISLMPTSGEQIAVTTDIHILENKAKDKVPQHSYPDLSLTRARKDQEAVFPGSENLACSIEIEVDEDRKQNEAQSFAGSSPVFDAGNKDIPTTVPEDFVEMGRYVIKLDDDDSQLQSDISDIERSVVGSHGEAIGQAGDMGFSFDEKGSQKLVQLANSLKELNEDEFKILMKMRDVQAISGDTDRCCEPSHVSVDVLDMFKEHIYVANVLKDIYIVQLLEQSKLLFDANRTQQQCDDKVSKLEISLEESKERNKTLDKELMLCQSELRTTMRNVEELSSAVHEWKEKYFRSEEDLSIISKDLYECRSLVENLQREKENLNGSIKSILDERNQHVEEKENMFKENKELIFGVSELKSQLADVHLQNESLVENVNLGAENMRKFGDEKEYVVQENNKLSSELADLKNILADVQAKHSSANESIDNLTEEKNRIQSQQYDSSLDIEKLTAEIAESKIRLAFLEAENQKLSVNLSSEAEENKKLMEENQRLLHEYEVASSENLAIQEVLLSERVEKLHLESDRHKANLWLEQLIEESIFLRICLEMLEYNGEECEGVNENQHSVNKTDESSVVMDPALHEHALFLERYNIELQVQSVVLKEYLQCVLVKYSETVTMSESLQKLRLTLESENSVYAKKLKNCQSRVTDMQNQSLQIKLSMCEIAPSILNQIRNMEMEISDALVWFDCHWNSVVTQIIGVLGKLDSFSSGLLASADPTITLGSMEMANRVCKSVDSALSFIIKLQDDLETSKLECHSLDCLFKDLQGSYTNLCKENAASVELLHKVHGSLRSLVITSHVDESRSLLDIEPELQLDPSQISDCIEQLRKDLLEKTQLKFENAKLCSELDDRTKEMEEIRKKVLDVHAIAELVEFAEKKLSLTTLETDYNLPLTARIENCISLLQVHKEADGKEECESTEDRGCQMREELQQLITLNMQQEIEIQSLRLSLDEAEEQFIGLQTELHRKVAEAEQSEQRVSSIREKLSIAVAKGKGLIVQRDNLKQSLAETSCELEKSRQQLQLSDSRLLEAETKLKTYAEAGERVEALESELSYIRNSATALRETFLLKDSVLQRIEEILEHVQLPEHLHSGEVIDKVDWLAMSVFGNSNVLPATAWDQKTLPDQDSYADNSVAVMDAWDGDTKNSSDDLRVKHEELQNKFYGLAEQNEMLEQSLMERNSIVQRLEEVLDKINMPAHLRSLEAASQIEWLGGALSDALQRASTLQESLDHQKTHCENLLAELEETQKNFCDIKSVLESTLKDKEHLQSILTDLTRDIGDVQERAATLELENSKMQIEIDNLQVKLVKNNEYRGDIESGIRRMLDMICTALPDHSLVEKASVGCSILNLEEMLRRLLDDYTRLSAASNIPQETDVDPLAKAVSTHDESGEVSSSDQHASYLKTLEKQLEEVSSELTHVKEESDTYKEKHKALSDEMEAVCKRVEELQQLLNQEEQKSATLREKLNVAVRKGKSLVQQRDSLKQTIEEMNIKVDSLTSEINNYRTSTTQYEEKFRELSSYAEKVQASESENQMLRSQLTKTEHNLQDQNHILSSMLDILNGLQLNGFKSSDPIDKLHQLEKAYHDLLEAKSSSDQEALKSKRAAELLLAELNEVQERNDALQDELAKMVDEVSELSKANQLVESARAEALSQLAELTAAQKDDQKKQNIQIVKLKSSVDQFFNSFKNVIHLVADIFSMDMDFFKNLESCLNESRGLYAYGGSLRTEDVLKQKQFSGNGIPAWEKFIASNSWLMYQTHEQFNGSTMDDIFGYVEYQVHNCASNISSVKDKLESYITLKAQEATRVSNSLRSFQGEIASRIKALEKVRETEKNDLLKNIALLYEACADSVQEIGSRKAHISSNNPSSVDMIMNVRSAENGEDFFLPEEHVRALSQTLTAAVRALSSADQEILEADLLEMKTTISNLQREIQEKDIQKERICMELVDQIKRAEAAAANFSHNLEVATSQVNDLKTQVSEIEKDKYLLEQKMKQMEDEKTASAELQEKVSSMTDMLSAKDQEIESLMQALDEEESELEDMSKKVEQMKMDLQKKNEEMGKLEHSHSKAMKKLSVTVSKFDELHDLSAGLLTEVEKLQVQLQEKDKEISFLRQEVTRCTNDIILASQSNKNSDEIMELYEWLKTATSQVLMGANPKDLKLNDANVYKESIQNQIASIILELEDLRHVAGSRNEMLQVEKSRVQELEKKQEDLETVLRQKEAQLNLLEEAPASSGNGGIEQLENKWVAPGPSTASQVRSVRKSNNDQVAIAIDDAAANSRLEDEDEDKVHGFKSLTTSRFVPRFTRPVSDMIDGLWVSCDRTLMRQPAMRLSIILYWALLHALLAAFIV